MSREFESKWASFCLKAQTSDEQSNAPRGLPARDLLCVDCVFEVPLVVKLNTLRTASLCFPLAKGPACQRVWSALSWWFCQDYIVISNPRSLHFSRNRGMWGGQRSLLGPHDQRSLLLWALFWCLGKLVLSNWGFSLLCASLASLTLNILCVLPLAVQCPELSLCINEG